MGVVSGIVVYIIVWWVVLFGVLPWGIQRNDGSVAGADRGAPQRDLIVKKFIITSLISAILWVIIYLLVAYEVFSFRELADGLTTT